MPSWNIHIAHFEQLARGNSLEDLGIKDANAFLFGNLVPDIYVGYMVPNVSTHIDYCLAHLALPSMIPVANADLFWDLYIAHRAPADAAGLSLVLGAWAHLVADRFYNGSFRSFWHDNDVPEGETQRIRKQADFELFGRSLGISTPVFPTAELLDAAWDFKAYRIGESDVMRAVEVANSIVFNGGRTPTGPLATTELSTYELLSEKWLRDIFSACNARVAAWLRAWRSMLDQGLSCTAAELRSFAGLPEATPDTSEWMQR